MRAYDIPPNITSMEWLNSKNCSSTMSFVIANDKKIRLFKLRKEFVDEFRGKSSVDEPQQDGEGRRDH